MITLKFNKLHVEGFKSIGIADLDFNNLGTCLIKGVNKYTSLAKSNGSGKSSLMESLVWCLYGKTSNGLGNDVKNTFYKNGCCVELTFSVDDVNYFIRRTIGHSEYKTGLLILKNDEDISAKNKTDSDKMVKEILGFDSEIFSQLVFLSQGFNNRFALYGPKARKEMLESLYNIDSYLNEFIAQLKVKESEKSNLISKKELEIRSAESTITTYSQTIETESYDIVNKKSKIKELKENVTSISRADIEDLETKLQNQTSISESLKEKYNNVLRELDSISSELKLNMSKQESLKNDYKALSTNKTCPYCGTVLQNNADDEHVKQKLKEIDNDLSVLQTQYNTLIENKNIVSEKSEKMRDKISIFKSDISNIELQLNRLRKDYEQQLQKESIIAELENGIKNCQEKIDNYKVQIINSEQTINALSKDRDKLKEDLELVQHMSRLANNQFRAYLLENIVNLLNNELKELSKFLFEEDTINIENGNKLNILIGDKTYEQLSGGEQRKVDIALIIAQRKLAQQMNAISSNILVLDEVFDGLDDISFGIVLDILSDEMQDIESTFIISHRDVSEIPLDRIITVTKDKNQISQITIA